MADNTTTNNQINFENEREYTRNDNTAVNMGASLASGTIIDGSTDSNIVVRTRDAILANGKRAPQSYVVINGIEYNLKNLRFADSRIRRLNDLGLLLTSSRVSDIIQVFETHRIVINTYLTGEEPTENGVRYYTQCSVTITPITEGE